MQKDVENRAAALAIRGAKITAHSLKAAIAKYLAHLRNKKLHHIPMGKQTVKQLTGQGQGVANMEIVDGNIKSFEHVARKYGVNYALKNTRYPGSIPDTSCFQS